MELDKIIELNTIEDANCKKFEETDAESNIFILNCLAYFNKYLLNIGPIRIDDFPKSTIHLFIGSNFDLLFQSYSLLKKGYFRPSLILLRPVYEAIVLCMYFFEFPDKEREYSLIDNKLKWIISQGGSRGMAKTIEEKGVIFNRTTQPGFLTNLIANPLREINTFIHFDFDSIYSSVSSGKEGIWHIGPKEIPNNIKNALVVSILEATLFSMMIMEKAIKPHDLEFIEYLKKVLDYILKLREERDQILEK